MLGTGKAFRVARVGLSPPSPMPGFRQLNSAHTPLARTAACIIAVAALFGIPRPQVEDATAEVGEASGRARTAPGTMANLGKLIFHDRTLSLNKNQSCASCHDAASGFS